MSYFRTEDVILTAKDLDELLTRVQHNQTFILVSPLVTADRLRFLFGLNQTPVAFISQPKKIVWFDDIPSKKLKHLCNKSVHLVLPCCTSDSLLDSTIYDVHNEVLLDEPEMESLLTKYHYGERSVVASPFIEMDRLRAYFHITMPLHQFVIYCRKVSSHFRNERGTWICTFSESHLSREIRISQFFGNIVYLY
jgi:hypothetical protein